MAASSQSNIEGGISCRAGGKLLQSCWSRSLLHERRTLRAHTWLTTSDSGGLYAGVCRMAVMADLARDGDDSASAASASASALAASALASAVCSEDEGSWLKQY